MPYYSLYQVGDYVVFRYRLFGSSKWIYGEGYITNVTNAFGQVTYNISSINDSGEYEPVVSGTGVKVKFNEPDLKFLRSK